LMLCCLIGCFNRESNKDLRNGIKNPDAKIRQIVYRLDKNKTIAQITWDPPAGINLHELIKYSGL
jgi:hypothetical protein